jgi:hypothetical protein
MFASKEIILGRFAFAATFSTDDWRFLPSGIFRRGWGVVVLSFGPFHVSVDWVGGY